MDNQGYVKIHRKILDNPISKKAEYCWLWVYLLMKANHKETSIIFNGKKENIKVGEFITGRKQISLETGINESKIERILKYLEIEQQIEQQKNTKFRRILIKNYKLYQQSEQHFEQQLNNKRTTTEQQLNTNKNDKNDKNEKKEREDKSSPTPKDIMVKFLNEGTEQDKQTERLSKQYGLSLYDTDKELEKFIDYWEESTKSGLKQRWELEKTWNLEKRLNTWLQKSIEFKNNKFKK